VISSMNRMPADSVDLVFGSGPYPGKWKRYGSAEKVSQEDWVSWMLGVAGAAVRISKGDVFFVLNGAVKKGKYIPAIEGLLWEWHKRGGICDRSNIWNKNLTPNRKDYFDNNYEFVVCFKKSTKRRSYFNWEVVAAPPKYKSGGRF